MQKHAAMAGWLVGRVMDKFFGTCYDYLLNRFTSNTDMKDKLERLRLSYPKITALFSAARRAQIMDQDMALNRWIWQLRDAIDEADDLLDDFDYLEHKEKLDINKEQNKVRYYLNNLTNTAKRLCLGNEDKSYLTRLEEVVHKLDIILGEASPFLHLLEDEKQKQREQQVELQRTRQTGSLPKDDLIGRDYYKAFVIKWLRKSSNEVPQTHVTSTTSHNNISLLSIVGHGGMGKTTLLQHIYQDDEIMKEFDLKMWVCVSDSFDVKKVISDMLESLQNKRSSLESLYTLQEGLKSQVMSKKFLLVLDDLWDKEEEVVLLSKWGDVLAPLAYGGLGSKILITTRTDSTASMIEKVLRKKNERLRLMGLNEDKCLQLLTTHAFAVGENPDDHQNLISIARELVKKLYGSPLAARVMGGVLNSSLDERHWRNVLNKILGHNDIFPILKLSYIFLPEHLQSCFSFCSIFEQDHIFDKDDLVRMWIAVGFIQPSHNNQGETITLEDIGESYFDILIKKSFFNKNYCSKRRIYGYKMHDLLHELAQSVSTQECFRFVGDEKSLFLEIPETIRHLSFQTDHLVMLKEVEKFKNLQTLVINSNNQTLVDALDEIFKASRRIRLLQINDITLEVIPENIGYLHHLRYLRFPVSNVKLLPKSLSSLLHLQFITLDKDFGRNIFSDHYYPKDINLYSNDYFPRDMNNLLNLRCLSSELIDFPGIGKMKFLQQVNAFYIKNENGYRIEELEHMNDLRFLRLINLENVRDAEEAWNAKLCNKRKLKFLSLNWSFEHSKSSDRDLDERVLDNLQPHNYLKTLRIYAYMGARSAIWMNEVHLINNLQKIELYVCLEWETLPPFGLLPFLKYLKLLNMPKVKRLENKFHGNDMRCVFPSLLNLWLINMEALVDWFDASVDGLFPCLTELHLCYCPNLQELTYLPPKLKTLSINSIDWKTLNCRSISEFIPLEISHLSVYNCPNITYISLACEKVETLAICNCPSLIFLGEEQKEVKATENCQLILDQLYISDPSVLQIEPLRSFTSTRSLTIMDNNELVSFPFEAQQRILKVSSSLRDLTFEYLPSLKSLPSSLTNISSLERITLNELPQLRELPDFHPSLKTVTIRKCDPELIELMMRHEQFPASNTEHDLDSYYRFFRRG